MVNKNFAVGLFVAIALVAFVGATIWLTGKRSSEPMVGYSIFFEKDVGGLMLGGPVFYLGVEVGTLTAMNIIRGNPVRVRVDIEVLQSTPIDSGTYAGIVYQGITGVAVIKLSADPGVHEPLQKSADSPYPVITARDTGFTALLDMAPAIVERLDEVLVDIAKILNEKNRENIGNMLDNIASVSEELAAEKETLGELPVLLKQTISELNEGISSIRTTLEHLEPGLESTVANLETATASLAEIGKKMEGWAKTNDSEMNAFMADGLGQVPALVADARATLREIEKLVKELREDPSKLIYQPKEDAVELRK
jgi:phospholipid/cholesterol/gamma-HCH transport system substrate-binding protein